jgi:hypothetical protein
MSRSKDTRPFLLDFFKKISGKRKTRVLLDSFIDDPVLVETLLAVESLLPQFEIWLDEMTTEGHRATIQGRMRGESKKATFQKSVEIPFALGCRIAKGKIAEYWFIADQLALLEQFG